MSAEELANYKKLIDEYKLVNGPIQIHILTPCYGGLVYVNYTNRIILTYEIFIRLGIGFAVELMSNESLITRARNNLICRTMGYPNMTHCLFIDADITWEPIDIVKLVLSNKELSGGIYPFKKYNLDWINDEFIDKIDKKINTPFNNKIDKRSFLEQNLLKYNIQYLPDTSKANIENNLIEIGLLPTGFMMLKRSCIKKMMDAYPDTKYINDSDYLNKGEDQYLYALFDCYIKNDSYYSEDWGFCDRWRAIGGKIYADITISLLHTGSSHYNGRLLSTLDFIPPTQTIGK